MVLDQRQSNHYTKDTIRIKVMGIGGGGNNAVNRMINSNIEGAEYYLINTEKKSLDRANSKFCQTIQIGKELTNGLGAGANPEIGEQAAIEDIEEIIKSLEDTDLLFLTAGMGGGTGTGAIPVIAKEARKMGIDTIAIVTRPFAFEGKPRKIKADMGIEKLKSNVNSLIVIDNNKAETYKTNSYISKKTEDIKAELENHKMKVFVLGTGSKIIGQYPEKDITLYPGSTVALLTDTYDKTIPNLIGLSYKDAANVLKLMGVRYTSEGKGYVTNQSIQEGSVVTEEMTVTLTLN